MITLLDREGTKVRMKRSEIQKSLIAMGLSGPILLCVPSEINSQQGGNVVVRFLPKNNPYSFWRRLYKRVAFFFKERQRIRALRNEAPVDLIIKPNKYVYKAPWLQLADEKDEQIFYL